METPVAPIGWPFAFNPPDGLTGSLPSFWVQPSLMARAPCPRGVRPIASYSISSATVKQSWVSTKERSDNLYAGRLQRPRPGDGAAFELQDVAFGHRQEILRVGGGAEFTALPMVFAVSQSVSTSAAAPSDTSEQSVRFRGPAT